MGRRNKSEPNFGRCSKNLSSLCDSAFFEPKFGMTTKSSKVYIRTFGCQMNDRDSEFIVGCFLEKGYKLIDSPGNADIILFNTCSVREHAEERVISNMGALLKREEGGRRKEERKVFGIVGCMAQAKKEKLFDRLPGLNLICGTGEIARLPELVEEAKKDRIIALDNIDGHLPESSPDYRENKKHAYVSIMQGCNNFCSYCVVPYVRGKERSRRVDNIVCEVKDLVKRGINEITLLGQNVNSYRSPGHQVMVRQAHHPSNHPERSRGTRSQGVDFVELLRIINNLGGIGKISFLTSHPKDASLELFKAMRDLDKIAKHLHLPLQSGSNRILKLMNRGYTKERYLYLVNKAKELIPDLRLTTDIIVGFPTETEEDFKDTLDIMKKIEFDLAYIFKYSPRPGTKAARLKDDVPLGVKKIRNKILLELQKELHDEKNSFFCLN